MFVVWAIDSVLVQSAGDVAAAAKFVSQSASELENPEINGYRALQSVSANHQLSDAESVIQAIGNLRIGWDGYGGAPITHAVCSNAKRFLSSSPLELPGPEITPTSNGTVNFEWASGNADAYLDIGQTRYTGHIQTRSGEIVYLDGSLTELGNLDSGGIRQALALISGLLYAAPSAPSIAQNL